MLSKGVQNLLRDNIMKDRNCFYTCEVRESVTIVSSKRLSKMFETISSFMIPSKSLSFEALP